MRLITLRIVLLCALGCGAWLTATLANAISAPSRPPGPVAYALPAAVPIVSDQSATRNAIRFFENRVRRDPEDALAYNKLAGSYLHVVRETGDLTYLQLAARAAHASLASVPVARNADGLTALALAEFSSHEFRAALDHAARLVQLEPGKAYPYALQGDALLELGEYDRAAEAYRRMRERSGGIDENTEIRLARLAQLRGETASATRHFTNAVALALAHAAPSRESIAWSRWQLGEVAFLAGDYALAERHDRDALVTLPGYFRALGSLARVLAARGDLPGATRQYEEAIRHFPDPLFVAALGDLYKLQGRVRDAADQYALVETIGHLSAANGALYNRQLALFHADHAQNSLRAYADAKHEYVVRRDIYGADAVAWTALRAGKVREARVAIRSALRLGTRDSRLYYHAGMIARAAGDPTAARDYLGRALQLSPGFDPLQRLPARKALDELSNVSAR